MQKSKLFYLLLLLIPIPWLTKIKVPEVNNSNFLQGYDNTNPSKMNTNLFYRNVGSIQAADPHVVTFGDKYYLYATNANGNADCSYLQCWSSYNLTDWTNEGIAYQPKLGNWGIDGLWAPEIIERNDKFYLYYAGWSLKKARHVLGVAISDNPCGPFIDYEGPSQGGMITKDEAPIDFGYDIIDASPFVDDDGTAYLLYSKDQYEGISRIYSVKLNDDMVSVDKSSMKELIQPNNDDISTDFYRDWERATEYSGKYWNEAPFMYKQNGTYYLFYSANYYGDREYAVGVATSSSMNGLFTKYQEPVLQARDEWDYISGTGHCSIFHSIDGKELFMAYHCHIDTVTGGGERKICFDRVNFINGKVYVNGPSISPQPLPSGSSEYVNKAKDAEIKINDLKVSRLSDGIINYLGNDLSLEQSYPSKKATITISFEEKEKVSAIMLYDSASFDYALRKVNKLKINGKIVADLKIAKEYLDLDFYENKIPISAFVYEFNELKTDKITLEIEAPEGKAISLNEIVVLGK